MMILAQTSGLKPAVRAFKPLQRLQQMQICLTHRVAWLRKLFGMFDREPNAVYGNSGLVGYLEFNRRRAGMRLRFDHFNLVHRLGNHARSSWMSFLGFAKRPSACTALCRECRD
jgi:hypothetical protein